MKSGNCAFLTLQLDSPGIIGLKDGSPEAVMDFMEKWRLVFENRIRELPYQWFRLHADFAQAILDIDVGDDRILEVIASVEGDLKALDCRGNCPIQLVLFGIGRGSVVWDDTIALGDAVDLSTRDLKTRQVSRSKNLQ